jgi:hypothetical protein
MGVGALLSAVCVLHVAGKGATALLLAGLLMTAGVVLCRLARRHELAAAAAPV